MKSSVFRNLTLALRLHPIKQIKRIAIFLILVFGGYFGNAQTTTYKTIPAGSFIVNMGVTPQTVGNGLKPYGLLYALLNANCPVQWAINPSKTKDGIDFSHAGIDYRGGPFIVEAKYRTSAVNTIIATWQAQGVIGVSITSPAINVPVYLTFTYVPKWTMDKQNGSIAMGYFVNAGIPPVAYGGSSSTLWKIPADLDCCDDVFVMPHADPIWSTHQRLVSWNLECRGAIWSACHAPSALENMVNLANRTEQANFLTIKDPAWTGTSGVWAPSNSLVLWGNHADGTPPYTFNTSYAADPVAQYMGTIDAATLNGSEQIYMPRQGVLADASIFDASAIARWRPETNILLYDPTQANVTNPNLATLQNVAAIMLYGRGFGDPDRGNVMYEAGHSQAKGTAPAYIAAQRAFFNFGFFALWERTIRPVLGTMPDVIYADETAIGFGYLLQYNSGDPFVGTMASSLWSSSCGGTFTTITSNPTYFTPPAIQGDTPCSITILVEDECGRKSFETHAATIKCRLEVSTTQVNPCYDNPTGGSINMTPVFGVPGYTWSYTKDGGSPITGNGLSISGLGPGIYTITLTDRDGAGCPQTFTVTLNTSPQISISATAVHTSCPGSSNGAINTSVSGGTPGFIYSWTKNGDPVFSATTLNLSSLTSGTYNLTATDSQGCSASTTVTVNQPDPIVITPEITPVQCYALNNGQIILSVTGGTGSYAFLWNDGNTNQNRIGLASGNYSVTVTDASNCTETLGGITISQPDAALSLSETHSNVLCFGGSNGSIDLTIAGGTEPYTYVWTKTGSSFTASTQDVSGLTAGTYNIIVTDDRGCTAALSVVITQPVALSLSTVKADPTCPPDPPVTPPTPPATPPVNADGEIDLTVSGGVNPYTYAWTTVDGIIPAGQDDDEDLSNLIAGTYTVVVTDTNNCTVTTTVTLVYEFPNPAKPAVIIH